MQILLSVVLALALGFGMRFSMVDSIPHQYRKGKQAMKGASFLFVTAVCSNRQGAEGGVTHVQNDHHSRLAMGSRILCNNS